VTTAGPEVDRERAAATPTDAETKVQVSPVETDPEMAGVTEPSAEAAVAVESAETEEQNEAVGGMLGGFWRRQAGG
jgi:hypothetical protein